MTIELGWWMVPFVVWAGFFVWLPILSGIENDDTKYLLWFGAISTVVGWLFLAAARWI